ncbi:MAG: YbgA family protein [Thermoplasmatota archaeon]
MLDQPLPRLYCSRCIEFAYCRFDGAIIRSDLVRELKERAEIVHDCPEVGIGLGIPRRPVRIVRTGEEDRLIQPATGSDHTGKMENYVSDLFERAGEVDGFILKSKSPTCGMGDVKIYPKMEKSKMVGLGDGFLGKEVSAGYSHLAVEDEKRLDDPTIRDHFLTKLYTLARFRLMKGSGKSRDLIRFHSQHKFLLMAYSQKELKELGRIVAGQKGSRFENVLDQYGIHLSKAMARGPKYTSNINVLMHCFGYVSDEMSREEKGFYLDLLDAYKDDRVPLATCKQVMLSYVIRFQVDYLEDQYYFRPYPAELAPGFDPKRDRELWK